MRNHEPTHPDAPQRDHDRRKPAPVNTHPNTHHSLPTKLPSPSRGLCRRGDHHQDGNATGLNECCIHADGEVSRPLPRGEQATAVRQIQQQRELRFRSMTGISASGSSALHRAEAVAQTNVVVDFL